MVVDKFSGYAMTTAGFDVLLVDCDGAIVEHRMMIGANDDDVPLNIGTVVGATKRLNVMRFRISASVC